MLKFFIDGSAKGLVVGAGVVEVDEFGFMTTHEDHKMHPLAESGLGELFALNLAMDKILTSTSADVSIFVDTFRVENMFKHEIISGSVFFKGIGESDHAIFIEAIREKVKTFYAQKGLQSSLRIVKLLESNFEYNVFTNTAHALSRCYFKHYDALYLDDKTPLKKNDDDTKMEINRVTKQEIVEVSINRIDGHWLSHVKDAQESPFVSSKHLVNTILYTKTNLEKELEKDIVTLSINSSSNIIADIKSSVNYVNCPQDIKNKGLRILSMFEKGQLIMS